MGRLFGTDGVRGVANQELTAELGLELDGTRDARSTNLDTRVRLRPGQTLVLGAVGYDPLDAGDEAPGRTLYYLVRGEIEALTER